MNWQSLLVSVALGSGLLVSSCGLNERPPQAGTIEGENPRAARMLAEAKAAQSGGDTSKALKLYEDLVEAYPFDRVAPEAQFQYGSLLDRKGQLFKAFEAYDLFIEKYPRSDLYSQALERQEAVAHAAADGHVKTSFMGIKSKVDAKKSVEMLEKVRDNAPQGLSAPKAQFAIGKVWQSRKRYDKAIPAFEKVVDEWPRNELAPEAQLRVGQILLKRAKQGNQDQANLDRAKVSFEDLIRAYPGSPQAAAAKREIATIGVRDIQRSFDIAEFYYDKGNYESAAFYYREVMDTAASGSLRNRAARKLARLEGRSVQ